MSDGGSGANRRGSKKSGSNNASGVRREHELVSAKEQVSGKSSKSNLPPFEGAGYDERQSFLIKNKLISGAGAKSKQAKLAKQETLEEQQETQALTDAPAAGGAWRRQQRQLQENSRGGCSCCSVMFLKMLKWKWAIIPLFIICCIAAIYCIPFIDIEARVPMSLPHIPFNYREGPLRASTASQFKIERLFADQISGPESVALDSLGNMYLAIEGGFILYAHLNKSSVPKRGYYINEPPNSLRNQQAFDMLSPDYTELVKIAELNGIKQMPYGQQHQQQRRWTAAASLERTSEKRGGSWRRECLADEHLYGQPLHSGGSSENLPLVDNSATSDTFAAGRARKFVSNVHLSRCSKPLGVRLSPDESHLYVVDTLSGLYRVNLKNPERQFTTQRSVTKLLDFRANNRHQLVPVISLDEAPTLMGPAPLSPHLLTKSREHINISLMAVDDLAIDYGAGTNGGDMIYLSDASQNWQAISFVYDLLEGRPSGAILRYDTGINQLSVLSPTRVAHVRTSVLEFVDDGDNSGQKLRPANLSSDQNEDHGDIYLGLGAPRLDENDIFDDRPLHFPNGIELTDDRQAILIADTTNKRIIKHYIKGSRRGTSDLWAWTPHLPDNIRRGYDRNHETYWVVGCGEDTTNKPDILAWLQAWPRLRKYILKNVYLLGWLLESIGGQILGFNSVRDFGYSLKIGNSLCESLCSGLMILQYNKHGDVIRSIYSKEFPNDITLHSQVNELIDAQNQEHVLYLSSPVYKYVTKLVLPSDSFVLSTSPS